MILILNIVHSLPQMTHFRLTFPTLAATLLAGGFTSTLAAQDQSLNEVVVTASGFEQQIKEAPASISVITREELSKKSYANLHDAIKDIPGVILTPSDNNSNDISLRGMGADYTLILIDGKRANSRETQTNGSTGTDQSWIPPLEAIERIEVVRGPMSSLYGSDAMGGVINIITRKVSEEWLGSVRVESTIQEDSKSGNAHRTNFFLTGPIKKDVLGLSLSGAYDKREEDRIFRGFNKGENKSFSAKLNFSPNKENDLILDAGVSHQHYIGRFNFSVDPSARRASERDAKFERKNLSLQHKGKYGWISSDTYLQQEQVKNISRKMTIKNTVFNSSWLLPIGEKNILSTGISFDKQSLTDLTTNALGGTNALSRDAWALFLENEWRIVDSFSLTTGARYDHISDVAKNVSPRVYGVWTLAERWTVKGGISTGFKAPKLRNLAGDWAAASNGGNTYGNPDLKPEKSTSKEIGLIYDSLLGTNASVTVFNNKYKDKISRVSCATCPVAGSNTYVNVNDAVTEGVEASFSALVSKGVKLKGSYTFTRSEQKSGVYKGNPLNQLPKHLVNIGVDYDLSSRLSTWANYSYRGKESFSSGGPSSGDFVQKGYAMFDAGGTYQVNDSVTVLFGVYNIANKIVRYDGLSWDTVLDGRRYWLGLNAKF